MKRFTFFLLTILAASCNSYLKDDVPTPDTSFDVGRARESCGEKDVWVMGYIVGCATSTSKVCFEPPFSKSTNLILGPSAGTLDRESCLSVELPSGALRSSLNLVDNPDMLGRQVYIKGDLVESYYGLPGLKSISKFYDPLE